MTEVAEAIGKLTDVLSSGLVLILLLWAATFYYLVWKSRNNTSKEGKEKDTNKIIVIKGGDGSKKASHVCSKCGRQVFIQRYIGPPPRCDCETPYVPILSSPKYFG